MAPQLTSVSLVLRHFVHSDEIGPTVSSFLGPSPTLSLSQACTFRSIKLLDWIWHSSCGPTEDPAAGWSLCNFLRSETNYCWWQAWKSLEFAAATGDLEILEWIYRHFSGCLVAVEVVELAARNGSLEALKFLLKHDAGRSWKQTRSVVGKETEEARWYETNAEVPEGWNGPGLVVDWGGQSLVGAIENGHSDIARWLVKYAPHKHSEEEMKLAIVAAMNEGDFKLAESLVPAGKQLVNYAGSCQRVEAIEMLLNSGLLRLDKRHAGVSLSEAAGAGRFDLTERIVQLFSPPLPQMGVDWSSGWCRAIQNACSRGHVEMLKWLVKHPTGQQVFTARHQTEVSQQFFVLAAEEGHVAVLKFLFEKKCVAQCEVALVRAVRNDQLEAVKWLVQNCSLSSSNSTDCVVDEAAKGGRLKILQFLHEMEHTVASRDYFIERWSRKVMDLAAGQGHLDVVTWLSHARSEGCSTKAMDDAAANGHLTVVKWLHRHRSEGCTRAAMDAAATNGFLEVVQWLDANTKAGCTAKAMDGAAKNGHLEVLRWLHDHRTEGCSADAINDAVDNSHTHVVWWLHRHYPRLTPSKKNVWIQAPNQFDMLLLLDGLYPTMFDTENTKRPAVGIRSELNDVLALQWLIEKVPGEFIMLKKQQ